MEKKYSNWQKKFFSGLYIEFQLKMFSKAHTIEQSKFIIDVLKLKKKNKVLDVPCGNGRISNELSKRGIYVTGVDNNEYFLNLAKKQSKKNKLSSVFLNNEMYNINFEREFDTVLCFWGSFGYFDDSKNVMFLEKVYKALKPHGKFLVNTHIIDTLLPKFQNSGWMKAGDIYILEKREYDPYSSRINCNWTFIKNGRIENKFSSIRLYSYLELITLLKNIGFKSFTAYDSIQKTEFKYSKSGYLYLVAQK
jgi:SAM-dependent methyltransferase